MRTIELTDVQCDALTAIVIHHMALLGALIALDERDDKHPEWRVREKRSLEVAETIRELLR